MSGECILRGSGYASTERLKNLEETPTGRNGWTTLRRVYGNYQGLGYIVFEESDNTAAGITVLVPKNSINSEVEKYPATLARFQDRGGKTMSELSWLGSNGMIYSLKTSKIDDNSVNFLKKIANSIAGS